MSWRILALPEMALIHRGDRHVATVAGRWVRVHDAGIPIPLSLLAEAQASAEDASAALTDAAVEAEQIEAASLRMRAI